MDDYFLKIHQRVVNKGGQVVLPSFGLGRSQELLMLVEKLGVEVWLDGMGRDIARILQKYPGSIRDFGGMNKAYRNTNFVKYLLIVSLFP